MRGKKNLHDAEEQRQAHEIRRIYISSVFLRTLIGILGWVLTLEFALPFVQDAVYYESVGASVAADWLAGRSSPWLDRVLGSANSFEAWGIVVFIAAVYWVTGGIRVVPLLLVVYSLVTSFVPVLVFRSGLQLGASFKTARVGAWLVALSPAFAFWSGALYKEGLILLLLMLAMYHALRLQETVRPISLVILIFSLLALFSLRSYLSLMACGVIGVGLVLGRTADPARGNDAGIFLRQFLIVGIFLALLAAIGFTNTLQRVAPTDIPSILDQIQTSRDDLSAAGSGYLQGADVSTLGQAFGFLPVGLFYFLTVPWPWDFGTLRQTLIIPETMFWILLYPLIAIGVVRGLRRNFQGTLLLLAMSLAICVLYALLVANVGTAYRLRIQVWVLWAVFAGWGWEWLGERRARRRSGKRSERRARPQGARGYPRRAAFPTGEESEPR